jgi:hypothetical protein
MGKDKGMKKKPSAAAKAKKAGVPSIAPSKPASSGSDSTSKQS